MRVRIAQKMASSSSRLLLVSLAIFVAFSSNVAIFTPASAQAPGTEEYTREVEKRPVRNLMRAGAARSAIQVGGSMLDHSVGQMLQLPPLPGEQGAFDSAKKEDSRKFFPGQELIPDLGKNNRSSVNMVLPPLKGFQQLSDSEELKNMFKEMVVAKVPVLFQTYMMVENGAAMGYMQSLNAVSNIMTNTLDTQQYQLKLLELTDDTGKMKEAYIQGIKESSKTAKGWPAALYAAVGDSTDFKAVQSEQMKIQSNTRPYDLKGLPWEGGPGKGGKRLLSDLLFMKSENNSNAGAGSENTYENSDQIFSALKDEFKRLVGDVEIELASAEGVSNEDQGPEGWLRVLNMNFKAPLKQPDNELRGMALENWEEVQVVWENINEILFDYCEFKKNSENYDRAQGEKKTAATDENIGKADSPTQDPWELASAPDITLTLSLIQQFYALVEGSEKPESVDCAALRKGRDAIPNTRSAQGANLDDCGDNQGCLRNRLILHAAFVIARSRTLHTYGHMYLVSQKFATDHVLKDLVDQIFKRTSAGMNLDEALSKNRQSWVEFGPAMAIYAQKRSAASGNMRPGQGK